MSLTLAALFGIFIMVWAIMAATLTAWTWFEDRGWWNRFMYGLCALLAWLNLAGWVLIAILERSV